MSWGWRLPFLASSVLLVVGILIRLGVNESPEFAQMKEANKTVKLPVAEVFSSAWRAGAAVHWRQHDRHCRRLFHQHVHDRVHDAVRRRRRGR